MPDNPDQEWRRLTQHYAEMWDDELLALAAEYNDLTDMAKQLLRAEMQKRNLGDPATPAASRENSSPIISNVDRKVYDFLAGPIVNSRLVPDDNAPVSETEDESANPARDYTWKTRLCDCDDTLQAQQLSEALKRAGIENWVEAMAGYMIGVGSPRVLVPADRLEEAQRVLAQPIPQDIIQESTEEVPEFAMPRCPRCGSEEPTLVGANPGNQWLCESCGKEWTETAPN